MGVDKFFLEDNFNKPWLYWLDYIIYVLLIVGAVVVSCICVSCSDENKTKSKQICCKVCEVNIDNTKDVCCVCNDKQCLKSNCICCIVLIITVLICVTVTFCVHQKNDYEIKKQMLNTWHDISFTEKFK